jgi:hypothetical protein
MPLVARAGRFVSAVAVSALGFSALTTPPAGAASGGLWCSARVLDSRPYSYSTVLIGVWTKAGAAVSATESAGARTWSMTPAVSANASGRARFAQKVSVVSKFELVQVAVRVALNGTSSHCVTQYSPPSLVART